MKYLILLFCLSFVPQPSTAQHLLSPFDDRYDEIAPDKLVAWLYNGYCPFEEGRRNIQLHETTCPYGDFTHPPKCGLRHFIMMCSSCRGNFQILNCDDSTLITSEMTYVAVRVRKIRDTHVFLITQSSDFLMQHRPEEDCNEIGECKERRIGCEGDCSSGRIRCVTRSKDRSKNDWKTIYDSLEDEEMEKAVARK